jgi:hypothetical protein
VIAEFQQQWQAAKPEVYTLHGNNLHFLLKGNNIV